MEGANVVEESVLVSLELKGVETATEGKLAAKVGKIKEEVEARKAVHSEQAHFEYFQALFAFSERYPSIRNTIEVIHIALDPALPFDDSQHAFVSGVLLNLDSLKELTLQHFGAKDLFAPMATLRGKDTIKVVNWEHNNIADSDLWALLRTLPTKARLKLVISNNLLQDEDALGRQVPRYRNVQAVEMFSQRSGRLNEARFREAAAKYHPQWTVPVA